MTSKVLETVIDQLAAELSRSVVINDPAMQLLYASPHYGDEDPARVKAVLNHGADPRVRGHVLGQGVSTWTRAGVIPANADLQMRARVCFPVRWRGELLGLVMVMDAESSITTAELGRVEEIVGELAFALHSESERTTRPTGEEQTVLDLVDDERTTRQRAASALTAAGRAESFRTVTAVEIAVAGRPDTTRPHIEIALQHALSAPRRRGHADFLFAVHDQSAILIVGDGAAGREAIAAQMAEHLTRIDDLAAGHFRCVAGIGSTGEGFGHAGRSAARARVARRAAQLGLIGRVAAWDALGAYGPVLSMSPDQLTHDTVPAQLQQLRDVDCDGQLAATLRAYLESAGNGPQAAARLHIHRTSLYYRLGRIRDLTGLDANDGPTRLACHLGFVMLDVLDASQD